MNTMVIDFECSGCGICCENGPPSLDFSEIFSHTHNFILATSLQVSDPSTKAEMKQKLSPMRDAISPWFKAEKHLYARFSATIISLAVEGDACPMLKNQLCRIHHDKPFICQCVPFSALHSECRQVQQLQRHRQCVGKCKDSLPALSVAKNTKTVLPFEYSKKLQQLKKANLQSRELIQGLASACILNAPEFIDIKNLIELAKCAANGYVTMSLLPVIKVAVFLYPERILELRKVLQQQCALIQETVNNGIVVNSTGFDLLQLEAAYQQKLASPSYWVG